MILFKFNEKFDVTGEFSKYFTGYRWTFGTSKYAIGFNHQVQYKSPFPDYADKDGWSNRGRYYVMSFTKHWYWGGDHFWYDGPRCAFSIGFIHFVWQPRRCKKCEKEI